MDTAFKALAEPRRREILRLVWSSELPAAQIAAQFADVIRSAVSQHLSVLREAELVLERREGTRRLYRANHAQMARLRQFLDEYWTESLDRLQQLVEFPGPTGRSEPTRPTDATHATDRTNPTDERNH